MYNKRTQEELAICKKLDILLSIYKEDTTPKIIRHAAVRRMGRLVKELETFNVEKLEDDGK